MNYTILFTALLFIACSKEKTINVDDLDSLTEVTIIADTIGSGDQLKKGDRVKFNFRITKLGESKQVLQSTFGKDRPAIIELGSRSFPPEIQDKMMDMKIGGKRSIFLPKDSLKRRPKAQVDLEILGVMAKAVMWDLGKVDYKKTASGLKYHIINKGDGPKIKAGDAVKVHYSGFLLDGKMFDSSVERDEPLPLVAGKAGLIKGWIEGILLMNYGSKFRLEIPPAIGYGAQGSGGVIPPNATLIFDMEILPKEVK